MRIWMLLPVGIAGLVPTACSTHQTIGTGPGPAHVRVDGIVDGYVDLDALERYDGQLIHAGIFGSAQRDGELLSLDIWPLFGIGVGVAGARVRLLPIEVALGTLFYSPSAPKHADDAEDVGEGDTDLDTEPGVTDRVEGDGTEGEHVDGAGDPAGESHEVEREYDGPEGGGEEAPAEEPTEK